MNDLINNAIVCNSKTADKMTVIVYMPFNVYCHYQMTTIIIEWKQSEITTSECYEILFIPLK